MQRFQTSIRGLSQPLTQGVIAGCREDIPGIMAGMAMALLEGKA
jgi:hypothetical protein